MASHKKLKNKQILPTTTVSSTNVYTSSVVEILNLDNVYLQLDITGTPTGSFDVQVSSNHNEDELGNVLNAGTWISLILTPAPAVVAGSPTDIGIDCNQLGAPYLRVVYTNASGTGAVTVNCAGKALS